jgi:acyl carrier protein
MYADAATEEKVTRAYMANQDAQLADYADELMEGRFETQSVVCPLRTISDVISENQIDQIDLLKLDVEKSELDVLLGIQAADWQKIKQVVAEVHDIDGRLDQFSGLLKSQGFEVMLDQESSFKDTGLYHIYAIHPSRSLSPGAAESAAQTSGSLLGQRTLSVTGLQGYLKERLPEYMIPGAFVRLDALPTLANGKVDRQRLPAPDLSRPEMQDDYVAPRNSIEERIAALWAELLGVNRVGVNDNFFELGGHSLLATRAISSLQEQFNVELSLRSFFETPTVAGVALSVVETLADPLADDQMAEILTELEDLSAEGARP